MRYSATLPFLFVPMLAWGQGAVTQSGVVTSNDFACWLSNGVLKDCGISSITITLPSIANGYVLGNASGSAAQAQGTALTSLLDTLTGTAQQGAILYRSSLGWSILGPGTSGQYLETLGAAANPVWASISIPSYSAGNGLTVASNTFALIAPVSVANGGTGLISGTSGGVLGYTASGVLTSSALLAQYGVMLGEAREAPRRRYRLWARRVRRCFQTGPGRHLAFRRYLLAL